MLPWYLNLFPFYILLAGLVGVWKWKSLNKPHWQYFAIYLIIIGLTQIFGIYLIQHKMSNVNTLVVDYFVIPFEFLFIYYLYFIEAEGRFAKNLSITSGIGYLVSILIQLYLLKPITAYAFNSFSYLVGNIFLVSVILAYFWNLILSDKILDFKKERMFWVSFGMLIFWLGSLPFYGLHNYLWYNFKPVFRIYDKISIMLNYIMYSFFIYSFLWIKKSS